MEGEALTTQATGNNDLVCFSHLRWDFVYQRPQHLLSRFASERRVFFVEEPFFDSDEPYIEQMERDNGLLVLRPHLKEPASVTEQAVIVNPLVLTALKEYGVERPVVWFYTPMMLDCAVGLDPVVCVYDCMDELSGFRGAPPELVANEKRLFEMADLVFTGGQSLYEAKKDKHKAV